MICIASKAVTIHNRSAARIEYLSFWFIDPDLRSTAALFDKHLFVLCLLPFPCPHDDLLKFRVARLPSELSHELPGTGAQDGRVTRSRWGVTHRDSFLRDFLRRLADFSYCIALAGADVVRMVARQRHLRQRK